MYAIIESGGKQYKAEEGRWLDLELLGKGDGEEVSFPVLLVVDGEKTHVGSPLLQAAHVKGKVVKEQKGKKVVSFRYRPKKGYQRKVGHRQRYTRVLIEKISI